MRVASARIGLWGAERGISVGVAALYVALPPIHLPLEPRASPTVATWLYSMRAYPTQPRSPCAATGAERVVPHEPGRDWSRMMTKGTAAVAQASDGAWGCDADSSHIIHGHQALTHALVRVQPARQHGLRRPTSLPQYCRA